MTTILNISGYKFVKLDQLDERREEFRQLCGELGVRGTVLLTPEGINVMLAGTVGAINTFVEALNAQEPFADLVFKYSETDYIPYKRLLLKIKQQVIPLGDGDIDPTELTGKRLLPKELKQWYDEGKDFAILDTRNGFEVECGTFENAIDLKIKHFRHFPEFIKKLDPELKKKPLVTFCTGGVRCEKATNLMIKEGFEEVYQLEGGIIKYFEECGGDHYEGECFVFDQRVTVDSNLQPVPLYEE